MPSSKVIVIGAGMGGLIASVLLAARGMDVTIVERESAVGGKMRRVDVAGRSIEAGPTVLTMRPTFDHILDEAGLTLDTLVSLRRADLLARHAWSETERLDLFADAGQTADAVGRFAGASAARGFLEFSAHAQAVHHTMDPLFMQCERPTLAGMVKTAGLSGLKGLWTAAPFTTLWNLLGRYFPDPRLRQLFARYATYCGSSPFLAPATLALIAAVEQQGVWLIDGGMSALAAALAGAAVSLGAKCRLDTEVSRILVSGGRARGVELASGERLDAHAVVYNGDVGALHGGLLGSAVASATAPSSSDPRSLSALTWMLLAKPAGFPLAHHNVFFSRDYRAEFDDILQQGRAPLDPTVYVCAQDRSDLGEAGTAGGERMLIIVNAPADDGRSMRRREDWRACRARMMQTLERCGLTIEVEAATQAGPLELAQLYPGTRGAIYGMASHGWSASFRRAGVRSAIPGLFLAGGSVHPGAGMPMAALSGRAAAQAVMTDLPSIYRSHPAATPGGTSTR